MDNFEIGPPGAGREIWPLTTLLTTGSGRSWVPRRLIKRSPSNGIFVLGKSRSVIAWVIFFFCLEGRALDVSGPLVPDDHRRSPGFPEPRSVSGVVRSWKRVR